MTWLRPSAVLNRIGPRWGDWVLPATLLAVPLVSYLKMIDYPLLSASGILSIAIVGVIGLAASAVISLRPGIIRPVVLALLVVIFFDVQFDAQIFTDRLYSWYLGAPAAAGALPVLTLLAVFLMFLVLAALVRDALTRVLAVIAVTTLISTAVLPQESYVLTIRGASVGAEPEVGGTSTQGDSSAALPPILHIVLDEHIGLAGIPQEIRGAAEVRDSLRDFYTTNGFRLFGRAYSHYRRTEIALARMFNGSVGPERLRYLSEEGFEYSLTKNAWFEELARRGYRLRLYQSSHFDICGSGAFAPEYCATYPMAGHRAFSQTEIPVLAKTQGILQGFFPNAFLFRLTRVFVDRRRVRQRQEQTAQTVPPRRWSWHRTTMAPIVSLDIANRLAEDLESVEPGTLYFAHLMVPHRAFMLDSNCSVNADPRHWYDYPPTEFYDWRNLPHDSRVRRYEAYFEQLRCSRRLVAAALDALDGSALAEEAIVIVHGDHGSRISSNHVGFGQLDRITDDDLRDNFSTLFAMRAPHMAPGLDDEVRSIQALFAEYMVGRPLDNEEPVVFATQSDQIDLAPLPFRALDPDPTDRVAPESD